MSHARKWQRDVRLIAVRNELRRAKKLLSDAAELADTDDAHPLSRRQLKLRDRILKFLKREGADRIVPGPSPVP